MDRNWDQDHFKDEDLRETVKKIHICAYINADNLGDGEEPPTNHWATFLEISEAHSVLIDMAPGYGSDGLRGKIHLSARNITMTDSAIHKMSFEPKVKLKIDDVFRLINNNGLQKYTFTPEWEGCRFWTYTLISHLEQQGIVESGSASQARNAVSYYYINPSGYTTREIRQGIFRSSE